MVTGAAGGLGAAICAALRDRGLEVVGTDLGGADEVLDVRDAAACHALARAVGPATWVNNAGVLGAGSAADQDEDEVRRLVEVNLLGVVNGSRAAMAVMRPRGDGAILNVGSLASWVPVPGECLYAATKHAVRSFSIGLAAESRASGVRVSLLCPDGIWTPMLHDRLDDDSARLSFSGLRLLQPEEVATAAVRLLESGAAVASIPRWRGGLTRVLGIAPGLSLRLQPLIERQARHNQAAERRRRAADPARRGR